MTLSKRQQGQEAESEACRYLESQGLLLVEKNYHAPCGEIDLIMRDSQQHYVFVEVRYRENESFGDSLESIDSNKQQRIIRTALHYLQQNDLLNEVYCRFDVVGFNADHQPVWIPSAFAEN